MSDDNVIPFKGGAAREAGTLADIPAENLLTAALEVKFDQMMVVGWTTDGYLYMAATTGYNPDNIALLEVTKQQLLDFYMA